GVALAGDLDAVRGLHGRRARGDRDRRRARVPDARRAQAAHPSGSRDAMTPVAPRRTVQPGLVTLVRGDIRELDAVEAAALLADQTRMPVMGCVLPVRTGAGLDLVRALADTHVGRWEAWGDVARRAFADVRAMVISGHTWRTAARAVWPAL